MATADLCRKHGMSSASFYVWKAKYGGMDVADAQKLKGLEAGNDKLKRLLANAMLDNAEMHTRIKALAHERRRFGHRRLYVLPRREGRLVSKKRVQRIHQEERQMVLRRGGRKRTRDLRAPMAAPDRPNAYWSLDFDHDQMTVGRRFRVLAIIDNCTHECLALIADTSISGMRVARELHRIIAWRGRATAVTFDNGTELTSNAILKGADERGVGWQYI